MKTITLISLLGCLFTSSLVAEESTPAGQLVDLIQGTGLASSMNGMFKPMLDNFKQRGMTDEGLKELQAAFENFMSSVLDDPEFRSKTIAVYENHYTDDEMKGLLEFYRTPLGAKFLETLPVVTAEGMAVGQELAVKHEGLFQKELERIIDTHMSGKKKPVQ